MKAGAERSRGGFSKAALFFSLLWPTLAKPRAFLCLGGRG